jgi:hypothetical protein
MLAVQGIEIERSTLAFWVGYAAAELMPLYERLKENLLASARLAVDETPVPVLDPGRGRTKTGYFWSMARDDRPFGGTDPTAVVYTYAPGRGGVHLHTLLAGYRGIVQCDGYAPYKSLPKERITLAFCWAHLRRQFFDIARKGNAPIATQALLRIAALYRIEAKIKGKAASERRAVRQAQSVPHVQAFKIFIDKELKRVSAKSPIADAIRYGPQPLGRACSLPRRRPHRSGHQHRRTLHPASDAHAQKRALRRPRRRRGKLGHRRFADRDLQTGRHRSASLSRRRAHSPCQSLAQQPPRRPSAVGMGRRARATPARCVNRCAAITARTRNQADNQRAPEHRFP